MRKYIRSSNLILFLFKAGISVPPFSEYNDLLITLDGEKIGTFVPISNHVETLTQFWKLYEAVMTNIPKFLSLNEKNIIKGVMEGTNLFECPQSSDVKSLKSLSTKERVELRSNLLHSLSVGLEALNAIYPNDQLEFRPCFLRTVREGVQDPHVDYKWRHISSDFCKSDRSWKKHARREGATFMQWVPFIAFAPLSYEGSEIYVWKHRQDYRLSSGLDIMRVFIPYGSLLILRGDTVHAGGLLTKDSSLGNPRVMMAIHRAPTNPLPHMPGNCFEVPSKSTIADMLSKYYH